MNIRNLTALRSLTIASLKMYFRNHTALFFSLFFPIAFIVIFGLVFKNTSTSFKIDLVNQAQTPLAGQIQQALESVPAFKVQKVNVDQGRQHLDNGEVDLVVTIPAGFGQTQGLAAQPPLEAEYNASKPQNGQAAAQIVTQLASNINDTITRAPKVISVQATGVQTKNLSYIDFLLPGMSALSIMQLGIFSVAFGFITYKTTGMLRRLQATPIHPATFLTAQGVTRLIMAVAQTILLVTIGAVFFGFHLAPSSFVPFLVLSLLGSAVFMAFGFAIAGWAKNEDQAQPVAQLIQFPMMFLSGTFFTREGFPPVLQTITGYLPLTYLVDGLRQIANDGASLWAIRGDILGLVIWGIIAGFVAIRVFRWE